MKLKTNRIASVFAEKKAQNKKVLIAYVTGGYPSMKAMDHAVRDLEAGGVDLLEIGVPFSDPIADGPVIQAASHKALSTGVTLLSLLSWVKSFRQKSSLPVVLMTYMNPVHRLGLKNFSQRSRAAGVDGVIVPDLVIEEGRALEQVLAEEGVSLIYLVAPTTPPARRTQIAERSRGFLYAVSVAGVTGARRGLPPGVDEFLKDLKERSPVPVAVGFGVSNGDQAREISRLTDGVIVGSAVVERVRDGVPLTPFIRSLRTALDKE